MEISKYATMFDGHLGRILVGKHHSNLNPSDAPPIHGTPYRAGSRHRQLERKRLSKFSRLAALNQPQQNGHLRSFSYRRNMDAFSSVSTIVA